MATCALRGIERLLKPGLERGVGPRSDHEHDVVCVVACRHSSANSSAATNSEAPDCLTAIPRSTRRRGCSVSNTCSRPNRSTLGTTTETFSRINGPKTTSQRAMSRLLT